VTTLGLVNSYVDSNIQNGQTYYYVTTVVDDTGAESGYSNEASAVVPDSVPQSTTVSLETFRCGSRTGRSIAGGSPVCAGSSSVSAPQ
jgi:hypothetical protein